MRCVLGENLGPLNIRFAQEAKEAKLNKVGVQIKKELLSRSSFLLHYVVEKHFIMVPSHYLQKIGGILITLVCLLSSKKRTSSAHQFLPYRAAGVIQILAKIHK